jgi:phytoene dehydrogenase-like protein
MYQIWEELGVVPKIRMIDYEYFIIVEGDAGKRFLLYTDLDRLERHMKELAPEDEKVIDEFIAAIRVFTRYQIPFEKAQELYTPWDMLKLLSSHFPLIRAMGKWKKISIREFARRFRDPFLRKAFLEIRALFSEDLPMVMLLMFFAWSHLKAAGYPEGGSLRFAQAIEEKFANLGGKIEYKTRGDQILVEDHRAVGVRLGDGREVRSDYVISTADGRTTIFDMLEGKYLNKKIRGFYDTLPLAPPVVLVGLGISRKFSDIPHCGIGIIYPLKEPAIIGGIAMASLRPMVYNFDPTLAPEGKTGLRVVLPADFAFWQGFQENPEGYRAEKDKVVETVIQLLEQRFPGISSQVEMRDVATPLTFERYTSSQKGSIIGWDVTTQTAFKRIPKTLPGLRNFWMAGQWVEMGGGIPMVALSGRNVIQLIAKKESI